MCPNLLAWMTEALWPIGLPDFCHSPTDPFSTCVPVLCIAQVAGKQILYSQKSGARGGYTRGTQPLNSFKSVMPVKLTNHIMVRICLREFQCRDWSEFQNANSRPFMFWDLSLSPNSSKEADSVYLYWVSRQAALASLKRDEWQGRRNMGALRSKRMCFDYCGPLELLLSVCFSVSYLPLASSVFNSLSVGLLSAFLFLSSMMTSYHVLYHSP
jgi:hypothetical protein